MMDKIHNIALFIDGDNVCKSTFQTNFNEIIVGSLGQLPQTNLKNIY